MPCDQMVVATMMKYPIVRDQDLLLADLLLEVEVERTEVGMGEGMTGIWDLLSVDLHLDQNLQLETGVEQIEIVMGLRIGTGGVLMDLVTEEQEEEIMTGDQDQGQALEEEGEVMIETIRGEVVRAPEVGVGAQRDIVKMTVIEDNNAN